MNTLKLLEAYVRSLSAEGCEQMPPDTICSVMIANNRILTAAVLENGGELTISTRSVHEMLTLNGSHLVATLNDDDSITVKLAAKSEILDRTEALAL